MSSKITATGIVVPLNTFSQPIDKNKMRVLKALEICAGGGGQALGLELAGFEHTALLEIDSHACSTLRQNRPAWRVVEADISTFSALEFHGVDLLAGGVPCPPFSKAGKQLGLEDERDLFPQALRLIQECHPKAILLENVRGFMDPKFKQYRARITMQLMEMNYNVSWHLVNASSFGVPQFRSRLLIVAISREIGRRFVWPLPFQSQPPTVGTVLFDLMSSRGWRGAEMWKTKANRIAPTIVGGSKKHGGPDLGPTRAKREWLSLGVDGHGIADHPPEHDFEGNPRLTVPMVARIQGFPDEWKFAGAKTAAYRQVGNAFPPPVAAAVAVQIKACLEGSQPETDPKSPDEQIALFTG